MNEQQQVCCQCGEQIEQRGTGRRRRFCDNKNQCKMAYHRQRQRDAREAAINQSISVKLYLEQRWQRFDQETTQVTLKMLAADYDARVAALATLAVEQELLVRTQKQRLRVPYASDEDVRFPKEEGAQRLVDSHVSAYPITLNITIPLPC
jgi:hypothetical protein